MAKCSHLERVKITKLPESVEGCEDCLETGAKWCELRICLTCGHVGCCDSSPNRHATAHAESSGHPIVRTAQTGEDWSWCYVDEVGMRIEQVEGEPAIPPSPLCP